VVDDDAENIFITMTARAANPKLWIVARASQEESIERLRTAGANRVYSPFVTAGREMAVAAINPGVVDFLEVETDGPPLRLEEVRVEVGSRHVGRKLGEVKGEAQALAVRQAGGDVLAPPDDDLVIGEGDVLVLLGERDTLRPLERQ
jgi:voltage-gated potassium channel